MYSHSSRCVVHAPTLIPPIHLHTNGTLSSRISKALGSNPVSGRWCALPEFLYSVHLSLDSNQIFFKILFSYKYYFQTGFFRRILKVSVLCCARIARIFSYWYYILHRRPVIYIFFFTRFPPSEKALSWRLDITFGYLTFLFWANRKILGTNFFLYFVIKPESVHNRCYVLRLPYKTERLVCPFQVFGNDSNKSKFDSGGNQEEIEFW
jgi:hypothetical protein